MYVLGVTGGSGSGKSTLGRVWQARFGADFIDADAVYHRLLRESVPLCDAIAGRFGAAVREQDGIVNRKALAGIVFSDPSLLPELNALTHPYVTAEIERLLAKAPKAAVLDAIALFQSGADAYCQKTVGVLCPPQIRIERIMERDNIDAAAARARIQAQEPDAFYRDKCDIILLNNASISEFEDQCAALYGQLIGKDCL